jgi:hypothetical protein
MHTSFFKLHILLGKVARSPRIGTGTDQRINREVPGNLFSIRDVIAELTWLDADFAETKLLTLLRPTARYVLV